MLITLLKAALEGRGDETQDFGDLHPLVRDVASQTKSFLCEIGDTHEWVAFSPPMYNGRSSVLVDSRANQMAMLRWR